MYVSKYVCLSTRWPETHARLKLFTRFASCMINIYVLHVHSCRYPDLFDALLNKYIPFHNPHNGDMRKMVQEFVMLNKTKQIPANYMKLWWKIFADLESRFDDDSFIDDDTTQYSESVT